MALLLFLIKTVTISLSGVMAPGAITAATIIHGSKNRNAGIFISLGHGIVEIPLVFLIILGLGTILQDEKVKIAIGLLGGAFLIWMGLQMLAAMKKPEGSPQKLLTAGPVMTGLILSATNPYFLIWWATVGLNLAFDAKEFGITAFVIFVLVHWLCDLIWLTLISQASFKGTSLLSQKNQKYILVFCSSALLFFGGLFIFDAIM